MEATAPIEDPDRSDGPDAAGAASAHTPPTLVAAGGQQCATCGAPLAADQRYCLQCGERRGPSALPSRPAPSRNADPARVRTLAPPRPRLSSTTSLIAGVGTLLLALGVGVLIGRSGSTTSSKPAAAVQVVTVPGGGGTASAAAQAPSSGAAAKSAKAKSKAAAGAASLSSLPASSIIKPKKKAPPPTKVVTVGSPGKGPGYQNGHFTGNFFGGG